MREKLGVLLVEDDQGQVSVQLFADPEKAKEIFEQLRSEIRQRATFLTLDWAKKSVEGTVKEFPVDGKGERMVGWKIGVGPIFSSACFGIQANSGDIGVEKK
jgi:predicted flavoprotein YhiN